MVTKDAQGAGRFEPLERLLARAAGERQRLGDLICATHKLTPRQLADALAEQCDSGQKLGEVLVAHGLISAAERDVILRFQEQQGRAPSEAGGALHLGTLLVARGRINQQQLDEALARQQASGRRIGEELVAAGLVQAAQVSFDLALQRALVNNVLLAALALAGTPGPGGVHAVAEPLAPPAARARIDVACSEALQVDLQFQEASLAVSEDDLARGYVDVPSGSRFCVRGKPGESYLVEIQPSAAMFDTAFVTGLGPTMEVSPDAGGVTPLVSAAVPTEHALGYRFLLRPGTQAGVYPWPLNLFVHPL